MYKMTLLPIQQCSKLWAVFLSSLLIVSESYAQDLTSHIQSGSRISIVGPGTSFEASISLDKLKIQPRETTIYSQNDFISKFAETNLSFSGDSFQLMYDYNDVNTFDELIRKRTVQFPYIRLREETHPRISWEQGMKIHINRYSSEKESVLSSLSGLLNQASDYPGDYQSSNAIVGLARSASAIQNALSNGTIATSSQELAMMLAEYDFLDTIVAQLREQEGNLDHLSSLDRLRFDALVNVFAARSQALNEADEGAGSQFDAPKREVVVSVVFPDGDPSKGLRVERYIPYKDRRGNPFPIQLVGISTPARAQLNIAHACYYGKDSEGQVVTDVVAHEPRITGTYDVPLRNVGRQNVNSNRAAVCVR